MTRTYEVRPGVKLPSVTTVLDQLDKGVGLLKWACRLGWDESRRVFKASGERGNRVHEYIKSRIIGGDGQPTLLPEDAPYVSAFEKLYEEVLSRFGSDWREPECTVWCEKCGYAGTLDLVGRFSRKSGAVRQAIVDWKTTSALRDEVPLQLAAYLHAFLVSYSGMKCKVSDNNAESFEMWAFRLGDDGDYEPRQYRDYKGSIACFRHLLGVYKWRASI
jgi:hypothetical protein